MILYLSILNIQKIAINIEFRRIKYKTFRFLMFNKKGNFMFILVSAW